MAHIVLRTAKDRDEYVIWSTIVDDLLAGPGTFEEAVRYLVNNDGASERDARASVARAETNGSSDRNVRFGWWDDEAIRVGCNAPDDGWYRVRRDRLPAYAEALARDDMAAAQALLECWQLHASVGRPMTTDDLSFEEMLDLIGDVPVRFWTCPIPGHSTGGELRQTVEWDGDVACCTFPGCLRRSDDPGRNSCECEVYDRGGGCCGEQYTFYVEVPERLLAAYEQAQRAVVESRDALVNWIDETGAQEIDPWEDK